MKIKYLVVHILDIVFLPLTYISLCWMCVIRLATKHMPLSIYASKKIGIFPIRDHYYEPLFNEKHLTKSLEDDRDLKGINFNVDRQLKFLEAFDYKKELAEISRRGVDCLFFMITNHLEMEMLIFYIVLLDFTSHNVSSKLAVAIQL